MKQSTSFAQVANHLLNVLQGYTKGIRFVAFLLILFTVSIGTASAEKSIDFESGTATYSDWTFTNMTSQQSGSITAKGGSYYGTTGGKSTASIQTKKQISSPKSISCYVSKQTTNTTSSTWYIQTSTNGSSWTDVKTQSATSMNKGSWVEFTADLSSYSNVYVRIYYSGSTAVRNIDNLVLTEGTTASYDVNWMVNGANYTTGSPTTSVAEGSRITTLPTNPTLDCSDKTFVGWSDQQVTNGQAPSILFTTAANSPAINDHTTFHAVFATATGGGSTTDTYDWESTSTGNWLINESIVRTASQGVSSSFAGKINTDNTYVTYNKKVAVTNFSFQFKRTSTNSNYYVYIETSTDNSNWSAAATYAMNSFGNGTYTSKSQTFDGKTELYVRFHCYNTTAVRYVDNVSITYGSSSYSDYTTSCTPETTYSVTYDYNYDKANDLPVDNNEYTAGSSVTLLPKDATAHKENCYFAGWATNKEGTGELYQAGDTYIINKSTTFYAKWVECTQDNQLNVEILGDETHEITISWNEVEGANSYMVFLFGESKLGYEKDYTFITSNLLEVINTDNVEVGEYMFEVTPYKDRAIVGCGNGDFITLTDIPTYKVSIANPIQNGTVTSDNSIAKKGDIITLTANPANGYQFESWSVTKEGGGQVNVTDNTFTMPASNVTVSAIFSLIPTLATPDNLRVSNLSCSGVTLAWDKVDGASNYQLIRTNKSTSSPITTQVDQKDNPSVYCTLSAGTSWSWTVQAIGDGLTYNSSEVATGEDFTLHYTITYNVDGGLPVEDSCGTTLPAELPTPTRTHYNFAGWYMDEGFNTPAEAGAAITQNTTLYAKWEEIKFTITWSINGNTTNSQELQEGTTITPPAVDDAATYACEDKVFVGWVGTSIGGSTNEEPDFITDFGNVKEDKTYYAVFATPSGDGFTLGQSGDFKIYANVGGEILYASNLDNGKLGSTAQINDAVTFIFTHKGNNQYTISNESKYLTLKASNSTDLQTQNDEYLWTIASATDDKGSWRVTSVNTPFRAIIYRSGYDFKAYGTNNITTNGYYDIEIGGATTYTEYVTSCVTCENVLTISKGNGENGKFTLDKVGEQETCDGLSVLVTPIPAEHYHVASVTASTGENAVNNGDGTYTITYVANFTGESTINVVFEEDTKYTVTWMVNGLPYTIGAPSTTVYADERVATLPTPPEPNAYCGDVFVGWTKENPASGNFDKAPTVYNEQSAFPPATGNQTFYAVFADYDEQQ